MPISRRYHAFHPSDLNREVDRKYAACIAAGGHRLSDRVITRDFYGESFDMVVCAACEVPIRKGAARGWLGKILDYEDAA